MRRLMGKLYRIMRASMLWVKALDLASKSRNDEALKCFDEIDKLGLGITLYEYDLLRGALYNLTRKDEMAISFLEKAAKSIQQSKRLSTSVRTYLLNFAAFYALDSLKRLHGNIPEGTTFTLNFSMVDLKSVPNHIKRNFALFAHPDWKHNGAFRARSKS